MNVTPFRRAAAAPFTALGLLALAVCGCQDPDEIRRYEVERPRIPNVDAVAEADAKMRILGAVIERPKGGYWFIKLMGKTEEVDPKADAVDRFLRSLKVDEANAEKPIAWTLPDGWKPGKGNQFSLAAFNLGTDDKPLELTVSAAGGQLTSNINRWRGQIGLLPISENQLPQITEKVPLDGGTTAFKIDLKGPGPKDGGGGMKMPPFMQGK